MKALVCYAGGLGGLFFGAAHPQGLAGEEPRAAWSAGRQQDEAIPADVPGPEAARQPQAVLLVKVIAAQAGDAVQQLGQALQRVLVDGAEDIVYVVGIDVGLVPVAQLLVDRDDSAAKIEGGRCNARTRAHVHPIHAREHVHHLGAGSQ